MKTRPLVSLVFGLTMLGAAPSMPGGETVSTLTPLNSVPQADAVDAAQTLVSQPVELPETAVVVALPQPITAMPEGVAMSGWFAELVKGCVYTRDFLQIVHVG